MNWKQVDLKFLVLLILFITFYFYYDYLLLNKIISIAFIGIFLALCSYILYGLPFKILSKLVLVLLAAFAFYLLPALFKKRISKVGIDDRFLGSWVTDSTGGYSIQLKVIDDSAYLSQSNVPEKKSYRLSTTSNAITLNNEILGREYKWNFSFIDQHTLLLYNSGDSLTLRRVR